MKRSLLKQWLITGFILDRLLTPRTLATSLGTSSVPVPSIYLLIFSDSSSQPFVWFHREWSKKERKYPMILRVKKKNPSGWGKAGLKYEEGKGHSKKLLTRTIQAEPLWRTVMLNSVASVTSPFRLNLKNYCFSRSVRFRCKQVLHHVRSLQLVAHLPVVVPRPYTCNTADIHI